MSRYIPILTALFCATSSMLAADSQPILNDHMGVATHFSHKTGWMNPWDASRHIPMIAEMGVGWIRDEIVWRDVEPVRGEYRISENTREWIELAHANGLKVIACFADHNPIYEDAWDAEAYARAAAWLAKELDGRIQAIEVLNEPFGSVSFTGGPPHNNWTGLDPDRSLSPWLARYVKLLNTAAVAIKAANPRMKVIGLGGTTPQNYRQLAMGISIDVDGITDHPYSFRSPPEVIPHRDIPSYVEKVGFAVADSDGSFASFVGMYREELKKQHGPAQLWFTESGWSTFREGEKKRTFLYSGVNEAAQARYSQRRFMEALALGVTVNIQYDFLDDSGHTGGDFEAERFFGLVRADGSPKPAYHAVQSVARATIGFTSGCDIKAKVFPFSDRTEDRPRIWDGDPLPALSRIMLYPFSDVAGRPVFAVWSAERPSDQSVRSADLEFAVDPGKFYVEATDLMTGEVSQPATKLLGGRLMVEQFAVPDYPVLIRLLPRVSGK
ncbi:MAG: cellulase family glycosylhydrolase [Opitutaceae bacterium]